MLPPEAGNTDGLPFEPHNDWFNIATESQIIEAMKRWFLDRYEDPANETPWDGEDKEYVFVWGGPYHPSEELYGRFGEIVDSGLIEELVHELLLDVGYDWAPIQHEGYDYDDYYVSHLIVTNRNDPYKFLNERIEEIFELLKASNVGGRNEMLLHQMAHSSLIAALEAYLADTVSYWVVKDGRALRRFISTNKDFQNLSLTVAELFERLDSLDTEVKKYLVDFVWHRLDKVKPMLISGLEITVPEIGALLKEILIRHDIVHRAGRRQDGEIIDLSKDDLHRLRGLILQFSDEIEKELKVRFPK